MDSLMQPPVLSRPAPEPAAEEASRQLSPAESDAMRFSLDKSVEDWRGFADRFASNGTAGRWEEEDPEEGPADGPEEGRHRMLHRTLHNAAQITSASYAFSSPAKPSSPGAI